MKISYKLRWTREAYFQSMYLQVYESILQIDLVHFEMSCKQEIFFYFKFMQEK